MKTVLLLLLALAAVLLAFLWRKNFKLRNQKEFLIIGLNAANREIEAQKEAHRLYMRTSASVLNERRVRIAKLENQVSHMAGIICPYESHVWDDAGDGVKRCRRCGIERRTGNERNPE